MKIIPITFSLATSWDLDNCSIHHVSRRYFSVVFVHDGTREHIMIDQPEVGILGFLIAKNTKNYSWLIQRKAEPGNVGLIQLAPTVQATKSNYQRVHGGNPTPYLDFFLSLDNLNINILGSEQGDRFLNKFNRNCKRLLADQIGIDDESFYWCDNDDLKLLLGQSFKVNTDARSVISSSAWYLLSKSRNNLFLDLGGFLSIALNKSVKSYSYLRELKARELIKKSHNCQFSQLQKLDLSHIKDHYFKEDGVFDRNGNKRLGYYDCWIPNREISRWQQPLIERKEINNLFLLFQIHDGVLCFVFQLLLK